MAGKVRAVKLRVIKGRGVEIICSLQENGRLRKVAATLGEKETYRECFDRLEATTPS